MSEAYKNRRLALEFLNVLTTEFGEDIYRNIEIYRNKNGKKVPGPGGAHSNWTQEQIREKKSSSPIHNCFDIYLKHCKNENGHLVCVDFDDLDFKNNPPYIKLYNLKVIETKSKSGCHCYILVKNLPSYSNEVNVQLPYRDPSNSGDVKCATDLISEKINMWEYWEDKYWGLEMRGGQLLSFEWEELKGYFDEMKMNKGTAKKNIPPKNMKSSPSDENIRELNILQCSERQFMGYLKRLKPHRYSYGFLITVGIICFNNFDGSDKGVRIWETWNALDETPHDQIRDR